MAGMGMMGVGGGGGGGISSESDRTDCPVPPWELAGGKARTW